MTTEKVDRVIEFLLRCGNSDIERGMAWESGGGPYTEKLREGIAKAIEADDHFIYTLITVSYGGRIDHSDFETLQMCEEAKSLALTGMTIEQNKAADEAYAKSEQDRKDAWRAAHPPRVPTANELKTISRTMPMMCSWPFSTIGEDGLVYDWPPEGSESPFHDPSEILEFVRGCWIRKKSTDIKTADCVRREDP